MAQDIPTALQDALGDRYRLEAEVGRGAMATVYRARDIRYDRTVAVKVLHREVAQAVGADRFIREIRIAARLNHPHILVLLDSGETDGVLFYVMPHVEGGSLADRLARGGPATVDEAVRLVDQVASALAHAHERGIIHRDIKPANILLNGDQAVVADFGVARAVEAAGGEKLTETGMVVGTPAYMSPEQAFDPDGVDGRADVYALGCILFELVAGRAPFAGGSPLSILSRRASQPPPSARAVNPAIPLFLDRIIKRALATDPGDRFSGPDTFLRALRSEEILAPVGRRRVAVLSPVSIGAAADQAHLILGLHESMISQAGQGELAVLARTSVLQFQDTDRAPREICAALDVESLVESSLFCVGDALSVQARVIDGASEETLWSGSFDGTADGVLSLFREVAGTVARELHQALGSRAGDTLEHQAVDPGAYDLYLRGRVAQASFNPADLFRAVEFFEGAIEIQADYAPAYAGLSLVYGSMAVLGMIPAVPDDGTPHFNELAIRAVELDPELAEAQQALAQAFTWGDFNWTAAERAYRRAIELDPNEVQARIFYCHFLAMHQRVEEADVQAARAMEIDPFNPFTRMLVAIEKGLTGRPREVIDRLQQVPPNPLRSFALVWSHFNLGMMDQGLGHYIDYFRQMGNEPVVRVMEDQRDDYRKALVAGAELLIEQSRERFVKPNNMVHMFSWAGDLDRAMEWIRRSREMRDHEIAYLAAPLTPMDLRRDARFQTFLAEMGLPPPILE